eukprot:XP_002521805.2 uncharacterized protein LOC8281634 [Ricinus communis]
MAEGSVVFLLTKLTEFLQKEGSLLSEVREEAEYINDELEFMKAFLRVAETMEDSDPQLKVFAKKVRYVVYDLEDALDDFKLHLPSDHRNGFLASLQKMSHLIRSLKARHQIALKMQRIKLKVISISETHRRYLIKNNIMEQGSSSSAEGQPSRRRDDLQLEEANPVGIERPKTKLIEWLFEDKSDREVVSVVGMAGLGKTTLVTKVYNNKEVKKRFEFRAWITLSQSFTTEDLLIDIILQLFHVLRLSEPQGVDNMDNHKLRTVINEFLQERRYLIVLDNVSDTRAWNDFERVLPNNSCGSRILLTTRNHDVALASSPEKAYNLCPLSQEESWTLFCRKIFQNSICPPHLNSVLQKILVRCQGLPLAIVAIGGVLATKDRSRIDEWELVHRGLGAALEDNDRLRSIVSLSYNDLPYYLKHCLMYFSIFPVGDSIEHTRLVRLWIAEGFVKKKEGMTLEEVAEGYLNELIKRSLVQVVETTTDGRVKTCRVHDILLEMIILKSRDQDFAAIATEQSSSMMWPEKVRRLSMHNVMPSIQEVLNNSRPRSLLMFWWFDSLPESFVLNLSSRRLRLLNVLDLEGTPLKKFPNEVVNLYLLKYLSLRNTKVTSIPSSISKLQYLETLDLKHTHVTELPAEILKLQKLRHLLAYRYESESDDQIHTKYGCKAPALIGSLQSLQKLCFLEANQVNLLTELGKLDKLRRLGIVKLRREDGRILCASIERLRNLRALSICSVEEREVIDIENLSSPPRFLQRLYLTGRFEKLPEWISSLDGLVKVVLKWCGLSDDPLLLLQHLPNLVHLEFVQVYDGEILCFQAKGFQRLKFLGLNRLDRLNTIIIEQEAMPNLEKLIVQSCRSLQRVPLGIEYLNELKILEFYNMPLELIMALHPNGGENGDYWKVERVPEVYFTYWYDGNWDIISLESFKGRNSAQSGPSIIQRPRHIWKYVSFMARENYQPFALSFDGSRELATLKFIGLTVLCSRTISDLTEAMAEGSVVFLLTKLTEFLQKEGSLLSEVREEVEYINDELEFMKAFLRVAEAMEDSDLQLKVFAKKVRYVVYDLEDALDDFKLHLPSDHGYGFRASLQKMSHLIKGLKARHQIALKMQRIKIRVINISETHRRYLIKNNIMQQGSSTSAERQPSRRRDALQLEEANPVGIERPKMKLIEWLVEDKSEREVVSVVGMGGLGKTTLVTKVYYDKEVKKRFEFRAWITLSQSFTIEDLLKDIILQLSHVLPLSDPQGVDNMDNAKLRTVIEEFLQERRYLIVLDNVSDTRAWYDFELVLPNNSCGSRILLTTRNHDVAFASSADKAYNLSPLSQEESWTLFCRKIFQNNPCPPLLNGILQKILVRCQGLPLAIVAIGGVLAMKDRSRIDEWELVHQGLGAALEDHDRLKSILSLSYNDLPYYLKYCLMYFSIFPVGDLIERAKLVRLWIAEGFVKEKEGMTLEEVAEGYLNELVKRSLVQVVETTSDGRVKTCRVHDILLEMIIWKSRDQDFAAIANEQNTSMMWPEKIRRLSIHNVMPSIQEILIASRPRSLLMFWWFDSLPKSFVLILSSHRLRLLNVLDLGGTPLKKFPNEVVSLYLLKYLSLRNTKVTSIPSSIGKLQNLETLDLKQTHVTELPAEILKLQKLCHLLVYRYEIESDDQIHTKYGCKAPAQIGSLQSLQKLCFLEANQGNTLLAELGKLNQLRRLGIVKIRTEDGRTLCASIERLRNLRALSISVEESEVIDINYLSSPPRFLQRLYLTGRLENLPEWISSLDSLVKVVLKWSGLSDDPLLLLQHLPNLVHLEFVQVYDGEILCFQARGFQRLKVLGLNKLHRLNTITIEQGAMPNLEKLIVQSCRSLQRVPLGIEYLNELKVLEFYNMPLELIMALHPSGGENGDYWKVERVPEVYFTYWYDGNWDIISMESFKDKSSAQSGSSIMQRPRHIWK